MKISLFVSIKLLVQTIKNYLVSFFSVLNSISILSLIVLLFVEFAFNAVIVDTSFYFQLHQIILHIIVLNLGVNLLFNTQPVIKQLVLKPFDTAILMVYFAHIFVPTFTLTFFLSQIFLVAVLIVKINCVKQLLNFFKVSPAKIIIFGFLFVIFIGSLLLSLPISSTGVTSLAFIDALFTSFSAVCVTGLTVNSVGEEFSFFGQIIILLLIQIGGLGIMSFSILTLLLMKQKVSPSDSIRIQRSYTTYNLQDSYSAIKFIFQFTLLFEVIGAILLAIVWHKPGVALSTTIFHSVFHSISAFCNAGFSLFSNSLVDYQFHLPTTVIISTLIILGGLGFPVLFNLYQRYFTNKNVPIKLQTSIALKVTLFLIVFGTVMIFCTESNYSFYGLSQLEKWQLAFFQSITARTAGFHTIDIGLFHPGSLLVIMILMIIGASPVSTGGGVKTTTFGLIVLGFWNILKTSYRFDYNKKTIHTESVFVAFATLITAILLIGTVAFALFFTEFLPIDKIIFEVISAFGTVGLSLSATEHLSFVGKLYIIAIMFIGRIGPFVFFYTFFRKKQKKSYAYPVEKVSIV